MHVSGSRIKGALEDIRMLLNLASLDAKFTNDYICRTVLPRAVCDVYARSILTSDNPFFVRMAITIDPETEYYQLPPCIQSVAGIRSYGEGGDLQGEWRPNGNMNPYGPGWSLEGNTLHFLPAPAATSEWEIWYIPSADVPIQYGTDMSCDGTTDVDTFVLPATPALGLPFHFANEPVGQILRIVAGSGQWYERVIDTWDPATRTITVKIPVETLPAEDDLTYEVIPAGSGPFWYAAAARAAMELGVGLDISQTRRQSLKETALTALKTLRDNLSNLQGRIGKGWDKGTLDNPELAMNVWSWRV